MHDDNVLTQLLLRTHTAQGYYDYYYYWRGECSGWKTRAGTNLCSTYYCSRTHVEHECVNAYTMNTDGSTMWPPPPGRKRRRAQSGMQILARVRYKMYVKTVCESICPLPAAHTLACSFAQPYTEAGSSGRF
jgi:hypothetical protein